VRKTFPPETDPSAPGAQPLTIKPETLRDPNAPSSALLAANPDAALAAVGVSAAGTFSSTPAEAARCLPMARLWDCLQLLYHLGVSYHFKVGLAKLNPGDP
jgi:hypothetical protein